MKLLVGLFYVKELGGIIGPVGEERGMPLSFCTYDAREVKASLVKSGE